MKKIIITLIVTTLFACSKSDDVNEQHYNLDASVEFSIFNTQNEDLLNPETLNHININNIRLFYVINGKSQEFYNGKLDFPRGYRIETYKGIYIIKLFLNYSSEENNSITYVQWDNIDTDTIEVSYKKTKNAILQDTIWLNDEQIWRRGNNTIDPYFILEK